MALILQLKLDSWAHVGISQSSSKDYLPHVVDSISTVHQSLGISSLYLSRYAQVSEKSYLWHATYWICSRGCLFGRSGCKFGRPVYQCAEGQPFRARAEDPANANHQQAAMAGGPVRMQASRCPKAACASKSERQCRWSAPQVVVEAGCGVPSRSRRPSHGFG